MSDPLWRCPECGEEAPESCWPDGDVYCEDCGSHAAQMCPDHCGFGADDIWTFPHVKIDGRWCTTQDDPPTPVPDDWKPEY